MRLEDLFSQPARKVDNTEPIFVPMLEKFMEEAHRNTVEPVVEPAFRASSMGYCGRAILYGLKGYEDEKTAKELFTLELGTAVHELIQSYTQNMDGHISAEETVRVEDIPFTTGHYDGLIDIGGKKYLLELKTCNVEAFQRLALNPKPYERHRRQATFYMKALGVTETIFVYINKNGMLLSDFAKTYPYVNPLFLEIRYKLEDAYHEMNRDEVEVNAEHFRNGTMPEYKRVSQCVYCKFVEQCKVDRKLEKAVKRLSGGS